MRPALVFFSLFSLVSAQDSGLKIAVIEGQDAINNVNQSIAREPVVRVTSDSGAPVEGASVTFVLPSVGPGGSFPNGANALTVTTDRDGRAVARGIRFHRVGRFQLRVNASYRGQNATAFVDETNISGTSSSHTGPSSKVWIILAVAAGAAAGGILAATHSGGSSSSSNTPIVITPGTPTVGGPH